MSNEQDNYHIINNNDRERVVSSMYTASITAVREDGEEIHMLECDLFMADGRTVQLWIPGPLLIGIIVASGHVLERYFGPMLRSTEAEVSDDALREMIEHIKNEQPDEPDPDRKHDDP